MPEALLNSRRSTKLKITKSRLKQIIKEELGRVLNEDQDFLNQREFGIKDAQRGGSGFLERTIVMIRVQVPEQEMDSAIASVKAKLASLSGLAGNNGALGYFGGGSFAVMVPGRSRDQGAEIKSEVESVLKELGLNIDYGIAYGDNRFSDLLRDADRQTYRSKE